jgi:hypothetical protein
VIEIKSRIAHLKEQLATVLSNPTSDESFNRVMRERVELLLAALKTLDGRELLQQPMAVKRTLVSLFVESAVVTPDKRLEISLRLRPDSRSLDGLQNCLTNQGV